MIKKIIAIGIISLVGAGNLVFSETQKRDKIGKMFEIESGKELITKSLELNVENQIEVANFIKENVDSEVVDVEALETYISEFESLYEDVSNLDISSETLKDDLKTLRDLEKEISKNFKEKLSELSDEVKEDLKEQVKELKEELKEEDSEVLNELKTDYAIEKIEDLGEKFDVDVSEVKSSLENGSLDLKELKEEAKELFKKYKGGEGGEPKERKKPMNDEIRAEIEESISDEDRETLSSLNESLSSGEITEEEFREEAGVVLKKYMPEKDTNRTPPKYEVPGPVPYPGDLGSIKEIVEEKIEEELSEEDKETLSALNESLSSGEITEEEFREEAKDILEEYMPENFSKIKDKMPKKNEGESWKFPKDLEEDIKKEAQKRMGEGGLDNLSDEQRKKAQEYMRKYFNGEITQEELEEIRKEFVE